MREDEIIAELRKRLPEILPAEDVRWEPGKQVGQQQVDVMANIRLKGRRLVLGIGIKAQPNVASIRDAIGRLRESRGIHAAYVPLLVAPSLGAEARQLCKEQGQAYLDLSGNVWIDVGPILIEKEVPRSLYYHEARNRLPFADKASLLLRYLLDRSGHAGGVREIAAAAGLSPGYVSKVIRAAEKLNYISIDSRKRASLRNIREMLSDWSAFYNWQRNEVESFFMLPRPNERIDHALKHAMAGHLNCALSLHAGNNLVEPYAQSDVWHLYVGEQEASNRIKNALRLEPVARNAGNVVLMRPYYRESVFRGAREVKGFRVVSDLQLYLDLRHYPVRGLEAAEEIFSRRLAPAWGLKHD